MKCKSCAQEKPIADFSGTVRKNPSGQWRCLMCQYPVCVGPDCGQRRNQEMAAFEGDPAEYLCQTCQRHVKCKSCTQEKPVADFGETIRKNPVSEWRCLMCQYPVCVGVECDNQRDQDKVAAFAGDPSEYLCQMCMYPRCTRCNRTKRPERSRCSVQRIPEWFCNKYAKCREAAQKKD